MDYDKHYGPVPTERSVNVPTGLSTIEDMTAHFAPLAVASLVDVAQNGNSDASRVAASIALLDRAYGKPGQSVTVYEGRKNMRAAWEYVDAEYSEVSEGRGEGNVANSDTGDVNDVAVSDNRGPVRSGSPINCEQSEHIINNK